MQTSEEPSNSHLLIIGGGEDRFEDLQILARFVDLCGGPNAKIIVVTSASTVPHELWGFYDRAFEMLGVQDRAPLHIASKAQADDPDNARRLAAADGIFMSGGDQKRLLDIIGGSAVARVIHQALAGGRVCVAGTSAGASAMSAHMLAAGDAELTPQKGAVRLGAGLGLVHGVVIDQHFSQRQRLGRLLSVIAENPQLQGIGIDENTALLIAPRSGFEIIGAGVVTLLDGREATSNVAEVGQCDNLELVDVRLHILPAGTRYRSGRDDDSGARAAPAPLRYLVHMLARE